MFGIWVVDKKAQVRTYTYFLRSLIDIDFENITAEMWEDAQDLQIEEQFFDNLVNLFAQACEKKGISMRI